MGDSEQLQDPAEPSDGLILAALSRAALHGRAHRTTASMPTLLEHLAIPRRSRKARAVRARVEELERTGELTRSKVYGITVWALTPAGSKHLRAAAAAGLPALPEAPQHAAWRRARAAAGEELDGFAARLSAELAEAQAMLAALEADERAPDSDRWMLMGQRLLTDCRRLGSAWYCLREWQEPNDARADRDEESGPDGDAPSPRLISLRSGRRNIGLWSYDGAEED
jgi:hypothetical protein